MPVRVLLQEVRKSRGLSQNELARLTRMSPQNIQKIEQGEAKSMTFKTLTRFCQVLKCQPGDLLIYEDDPDSQGQDSVEASLTINQLPRQSGAVNQLKSPSNLQNPYLNLVADREIPKSA